MGARYDVGEFFVPAAILGTIGYGLGRLTLGKRAGMGAAAMGVAVALGGTALAQKSQSEGAAVRSIRSVLDRIDLSKDAIAAENEAAESIQVAN